MKFCPVCRHRYDETQNFCLNDGTLLVNSPSETEAPTAVLNKLNDSSISTSAEIPTVVRQVDSNNPVPANKTSGLSIALASIFGTLIVIGIIGGGIWFVLSGKQNTNQIKSNSSPNLNQNSSPNTKSNSSNTFTTPMPTNSSKSNEKTSTVNTSDLTNNSKNLTEQPRESPIPTTSPLAESTVNLQVKFSSFNKTKNFPLPGSTITIQAEGKTITSKTNNAGIAYFNNVSCGKQVKITVSGEDGSGTFSRNLKCDSNASWSYQADCFAAGKNGGCAIEQVK